MPDSSGRSGSDRSKNALKLWSDAPRFEPSTAPLADGKGKPLAAPITGKGDHAIVLNDQQVRVVHANWSPSVVGQKGRATH